MWISKRKYEELKRLANDNKRDADSFRSIVEILEQRDSVYYSNMFIVKPEILNKILQDVYSSKDKLKK